jgi:hypothetical protein
MNAATWNHETVMALRGIIKNSEAMDALSHIPHISEEPISLINRWPNVLNCDFIRKDNEFMKSLADHDSNPGIVEELICMKDDHERQMFNEHFGLTFFPEPPISGNSDIEPVSTARQLLQEGFDMNNCVASYMRRIETGDCFIYRVFKPQRCTLSIAMENGKPCIEEIRAKNNSIASPEAVLAVKRWIREEIEVKRRFIAEKYQTG